MAVESASGVTVRRHAVAAPTTFRKSPHPLNAAFVRTWRNPLGFFGLAILGLLVLIALAAPMFAFPPILLGFVIIAALGQGTTQVAYAIALAVVPTLGRVARSLVLKERNRDYVLAARCTGARNGRVMFLHVLPNAVSPMIVN